MRGCLSDLVIQWLRAENQRRLDGLGPLLGSGPSVSSFVTGLLTVAPSKDRVPRGGSSTDIAPIPVSSMDRRPFCVSFREARSKLALPCMNLS